MCVNRKKRSSSFHSTVARYTVCMIFTVTGKQQKVNYCHKIIYLVINSKHMSSVIVIAAGNDITTSLADL